MVSQTEQAFNIDAEGRRRRRPSQAYLERSKEGTGQVVENVLGALPGIGTAMTVEEIQEELQKDDPNYGKIALLGGSELIGLIPGLGIAAKAGLRKVASSIGADRLIKALDAPEPKPESEIIAGPGATGYYGSNYDRAKELKERGYSPAQIEQMTGRFQTGKSSDYVGDIPENPFKFEIDDSRVEIRGSDGFQTLKESTKHYPIAVGNIIPTHTELFKEYPNLRNVVFYIDPKKTGSGAHFDDTVGTHGAIVFGPNNKSLTSPNKKGFRNTFFHELQHAAQFQDYKIAGLKQLGGNPVFFGRVGTKEYPSYKIEKDILEKNKNFVKLRDEILDIFEKQRGTGALDQTSTGAILPGQVPNPSEVFGDIDVAKKIARKMRELESELFKTYMRTVSEVEARVVGRRAAEIATVGSVPKPRVTSNLARERKIETLKEFQSDEPKSLMGKKVEDFKLKLGPMTDEEILRYATGGINFARYAKGIDEDLQGFDLFGPTKPNYAEGGLSAQTKEAFKQPKKGLSYGELIIDNILGLDNEYESFGEKLGKAIDEDEINFLKNAAVGIYEGAKEFVTSPVETTKKVVTDIKDSVQRLGTEDLDTRLKNMYGISYNEATDEQVNKAKEAVFGDALTALELIPAAKGTTAVAKAGSAAIPSGIKADVVGQTKALLSGDTEFLKGTPTERSATQSLSAGFTGQNPPTYIPKDEPPFDPDGIYETKEGILKFREPIAEFTRKLTMTNSFPSKGMTGAEFLNLLEKNAESIPPSSYKEGLVDKDKRYTREELLDAVTKSPAGLPESIYYNLADLDTPPKFGTYQRQTEVGFTGYPRYPEDTSYFSIPILSRTAGNTFKANYQHFNPDTTAHVRGSFIDPLVGFEVNKTLSPEFKSIIGKDQPYLLVEEIQSDLLQKGYRKPKNSFDAAFDKAANEAMTLPQLTFQEAYGDVTNELKSIIKTLESKNIVAPEEPVRLQLPFRIGLTHPQFKNRRRTDFLEELKAPERGTVDGTNLVNFEEIKDYIDKQGVNSTHIYQILNDIEKSANSTRPFNPFESISFVGPNGGKVYKDIIVKAPDPDDSGTRYKYIVDEESTAYNEFLADFDEYTKQFGLNFDDLMDAYNNEYDKYYDAIYKEMEAKNLSRDYGSFVTGMYEKFRKIRADEALLGDQTNTALPPVRKNKQTVEEALKVLIAKADEQGVDKIVIPPASKIAEARGRTIDPSDKGDRFYRTYVTDLNRSLEELEANYPVTVYKDVELPYKKGIKVTEPLGDELLPPSQRKKSVGIDNKGTIIDISKLREQFQVDKPRQFAEGGTVDMNRQMEMAFMREGGLRDDGMDVDPVSGNEVPPGSMAKEVRDDIPARLSEGEYVVPADVVQYYGVKFFEDLRADAKIGLQEMERNGRIGGEPVDDDDLSEAEMMEIQTMMQGGMVQPQQQMDPYFQQNLMYQQPIGMANGGYSAPVIPNIGSGFSWETSGPGSITPTVPVETPETCAAKGMVYNPETKMCEPAPVTTPVVTDTGRDDRPEAPTPEPWYESITSSAEDSVNRYFGTGAKIGAGIAGFVGAASPLGILGGAGLKYGVQGTNIAQARAEVALRTAAGDVEGAEMLQKAIDKAIKGTVGLEKADQFFENTFNASGERNVISALEAIGITVPDSIKSKDFRKDPNFDSDLMDFIQSQGSKIRTDIFKMETKPTPTPSNNGNQGTLSSVASTHKERYGLDGSRRKDDSPSAAERHKKAVEATKKIEASTPKVKTKTARGSMADVSDRAGGAAKSYSDIAKKDDPYGLLNKGGLMKKKKK